MAVEYISHLKEQHAKIINVLIFWVAIALIPIGVLVVIFAGRNGWTLYEAAQLFALLVVWMLALKPRLLSAKQRAVVVAIALAAAAASELLRYDALGVTYPLLVIVPILATMVFGVWAGLAAGGVVTATFVGVVWRAAAATQNDTLTSPLALFTDNDWAAIALTLATSTGAAIFAVGALLKSNSRTEMALRAENNNLMRSQARIEQASKLAGLGYALTNQITGEIVRCDEAYAKMHGMTVAQLTATNIFDGIIGRMIHEDDRATARAMHERIVAGESMITELRHVRPNGEVRRLRKVFSPLNSATPSDGLFEVVCHDVTESYRLQQQLFQAQKMDAIGQLTGGVAHDFNNLLAVMMANVELLEDGLKDVRDKEYAANVIEAILRGADLTRNMLSFARQAPLEPALVDLNQLVRNLKNWIGRTIPTTIDVETSLLAGLWPTMIDASSAESGLLNLILNARDAMPEGGKLTIETSNVRVDDEYIELRGEDIVPGRYVLLAVSDTGEGIRREDLAKIFEPFFTTKSKGTGTGLGLSMLEGFMRQSGGAIRVYSEPSVGTTFKLYFPVSDAAPPPPPTARPASPVTGSRERATILLVEDNAGVRTSIRAALLKEGYRVFDAPTGDDGRLAFEQQPDIDVLLTDIVMPGKMQGTELAKYLRGIRPDLCVVFMSGYANEAAVHGNGLRPRDVRLMKPVRRDDLLAAIAKVLAERTSARPDT